MKPLILPFFGLGYDLSLALKKGMDLDSSGPHVFRTQALSSQYIFRSGIELLIYLNRETGGS